MLPFRMGDKASLQEKYHEYFRLIMACNVPKEELGKVGYLTVSETYVKKGDTQRRPGIHVEKVSETSNWGGNWGGGGGNGGSGLYMASNVDDTCRVWDYHVETPGHLGDCEHLRDYLTNPISMKAGMLIWMTDSCPHEALPQHESAQRQFFRLVTSRVDFWYSAHNTLNPLVPHLPKHVKIIHKNKFSS